MPGALPLRIRAHSMDRRLLISLWVLAVAACLALYAANLLLGEVNQDEGWYLYAARLVSEGKLPYMDFAFTQGPIVTYAYALGWPLVERWGVAGGRLFTVLLGLVGCGFAVMLVRRLVPRDRRDAAALIAFALIAVNVYQTYFTAVVKTYAITALFLTAGFFALSYAGTKRRWPAAVAGALMALAAGCRSSAAVVLPLLCGILLMRAVRPEGDRDADRKTHRWTWLWFGAAAALTGVLVFVPYLIKVPAALWFGLVEYHTGREGPGVLGALVYKGGFLSRVLRGYFVAAAVGVATVAWQLVGPGASRSQPISRAGRMERLLWASVAIVSLVHIAAPFPYDDYQAIVFPLAAAALAVGVVRCCPAGALQAVSTTIVLLCVAAAFSSARNQEWFVGGRDRIWWPLRAQSSLATLQQAGRKVRELAAPGEELLTQDAYLAVEAGMRLPSGLELGPFSYFPELSDEEAVQRHVLNGHLLQRVLEESEAPVAAISDWTFSIYAPAVTRVTAEQRQALLGIVERRYEPVAAIDAFGQADTRLVILRRR